MASKSAPRMALYALAHTRPAAGSSALSLVDASRRCLHIPNSYFVTSSGARLRPSMRRLRQPVQLIKPAAVGGGRTIFIQTDRTPNPDVRVNLSSVDMRFNCRVGPQIPP